MEITDVVFIWNFIFDNDDSLNIKNGTIKNNYITENDSIYNDSISENSEDENSLDQWESSLFAIVTFLYMSWVAESLVYDP